MFLLCKTKESKYGLTKLRATEFRSHSLNDARHPLSLSGDGFSTGIE